MGNTNKLLSLARKQKKDEFYTQYADIENELQHYIPHFENKIIYCNCDNPYESNFFKYFVLNFKKLKLKRLVASGYYQLNLTKEELEIFNSEHTPPVQTYAVYINDTTGITEDVVKNKWEFIQLLFKNVHNVWRKLNADFDYPAGDFRSKDCLFILKHIDIVVTNPPFSLFRDYIKCLSESGCKFLVIGNQNAVTYKEIFPLIKDNKLWLGYGFPNKAGYFQSVYEDTATCKSHKKGLIRVSGVCWFTNLDIPKKHQLFNLTKHYDPAIYLKYDSCDAINVNRVSDIPCDYDGIMGVPITFLDKYNSQQFEIVGKIDTANHDKYILGKPIVNGKLIYKRLAIRKL